jgi:hypothetical protein
MRSGARQAPMVEAIIIYLLRAFLASTKKLKERCECCADIEEGMEVTEPEAELARPVRWNQPAVVIIACCIILGVLGSGVGYAIRCSLLPCTFLNRQRWDSQRIISLRPNI